MRYGGIPYTFGTGNAPSWQRRKVQDYFKDSKKNQASRAFSSGEYAPGRDAHGRRTKSMKLEAFKITADKWHVRLRFRREDVKKLKAQTTGEIDSEAKQGKLPRTNVHVSMHIIPAVRMLEHISEGYLAELKEIEGTLHELDSLNILLAENKESHTNEELGGIISRIEDYLESVSPKKRAALKRLAAGNIEKTVALLKEALALPENLRDFTIGTACTKFTKARNRLAARERDIAGLYEYNRMRECALRLAQDQWLLSKLAQYSETPEEACKYAQQDAERLHVLSEIKSMLCVRANNGKADERRLNLLAYITVQCHLFKSEGRVAEGADKAIEQEEKYGIRPNRWKKYDYLLGYYRWLYRHVRDGNKEGALAKLHELETFVNANQPSYILAQLEKTGDEYLSRVLEHLRYAATALDSREPGIQIAKLHFKAAWAALQN